MKNLLHKSKLNEFCKWLEARGYTTEKTKGDYEVLRSRFDKSNIVIIYDRHRAKEHYTTFGLGEEMARKFINETKSK